MSHVEHEEDSVEHDQEEDEVLEGLGGDHPPTVVPEEVTQT